MAAARGHGLRHPAVVSSAASLVELIGERRHPAAATRHSWPRRRDRADHRSAGVGRLASPSPRPRRELQLGQHATAVTSVYDRVRTEAQRAESHAHSRSRT